MKASIKLLFVCLIFISSINAKEPDWKIKKPLVNNYFIGIAGIEKAKFGTDYKSLAKNLALNDLSSEITVSINAEVSNKIKEINNNVEQEFTSYVKANTKADLEDYELVDSWENENEYWVFYRLSKEVYFSKRARKIHGKYCLSTTVYQRWF